jgi:hypothetical protein
MIYHTRTSRDLMTAVTKLEAQQWEGLKSHEEISAFDDQTLYEFVLSRRSSRQERCPQDIEGS